jgi:hypothetical protein
VESEGVKEVEKVRRFDDVFRMLIVVMSITTSVGLSLYKIDLFPALAYFLLSLGFWMFAHLSGSNELLKKSEIELKITSWFFALLVTGSTLAKFAEKSVVLDNYAKGAVSIIALGSTYLLYLWFVDVIPSKKRMLYTMMIYLVLGAFTLGYLGF